MANIQLSFTDEVAEQINKACDELGLTTHDFFKQAISLRLFMMEKSQTHRFLIANSKGEMEEFFLEGHKD